MSFKQTALAKLRELIVSPDVSSCFYIYNDAINDSIKAIESIPEDGGWISLKDSQPPLQEPVLTWNGEYVMEGSMTGARNDANNNLYCYFDSQDGVSIQDVTHFQPLPPPPNPLEFDGVEAKKISN